MERLRTTSHDDEDQLDYLYDVNFLKYTPIIVIGQSRYKVMLCNRLQRQCRETPSEIRPILLSNVLDFDDDLEPNLQHRVIPARTANCKLSRRVYRVC